MFIKMFSCCICMVDCCCICIPLGSKFPKPIKGFWIMIWILTNSYFLFSPTSPDISFISDYAISMPLASITYYCYIITTCLMILSLFNWQHANNPQNHTSGNISGINTVQLMCMLYQISYFSELSYFPEEFYYTIIFSPLICSLLNLTAWTIRFEDFWWLIFFWIGGITILLIGLNLYQIISFIWWWIIVPATETFIVIIVCISYCAGIYFTSKDLKLSHPLNRNAHQLPIIEMLPEPHHILSILLLIGLAISVEYVLFTFSWSYSTCCIICFFMFVWICFRCTFILFCYLWHSQMQ